MSVTLNEVIKDLKTRLQDEIDRQQWYTKQMREMEEKIINLKHTIADLEGLQYGNSSSQQSQYPSLKNESFVSQETSKCRTSSEGTVCTR
jgi:hypothetical protein